MRVAISAIASVVFVSGAAIAQSDVAVKAPPNAEKIAVTQVGRTTTGVPVLDVSLSSAVNLEGLDLSSSAGAAELANRINDAALAACKELALRYPDTSTTDAECAEAAAAKAMVKARKLVAASHAVAANK
jgi:UrcA family protein